jgi:hypothetical protein
MAKSNDAGKRATPDAEDNAALLDQHGHPMHHTHDHHDDQPKDHSLPPAVQANVTPESVPAPAAQTPVVDEHAVSHPAPEMAAGSRYVLPKWRSHSEVYAAPIHSFDDQFIHVDGGDNPNVMQLVMVQRPAGIFDRGEPAIGDYLIMYPGGGMAWMPKKAFEATHDRMPDSEV